MVSFAATISPSLPFSYSSPHKPSHVAPNSCSFAKLSTNPFNSTRVLPALSPSMTKSVRLSPRAAAASAAEYTEESETKVKFQKSMTLPGCSSSLSLLGTGYREKVFAIIGVKVYAAGLYANPSIFSKLDSWKGRSSAELEKDSSVFDTIFHAPLEKSLKIVLLRDIDGKTFWDALDEAISPRMKSPEPADKSALSAFRVVFQGRPLKKGTFIFLTWLDTAKMLVSVSNGLPSSVDATIESSNATSALFDVFLGGNPVSPSLKASVSKGLAAALH